MIELREFLVGALAIVLVALATVGVLTTEARGWPVVAVVLAAVVARLAEEDV